MVYLDYAEYFCNRCDCLLEANDYSDSKFLLVVLLGFRDGLQNENIVFQCLVLYVGICNVA